MKKLLTLLPLIFALAGNGQQPEYILTGEGSPLKKGAYVLPYPKPDTIAIVYLWCDTAKRSIRDGFVVGGIVRWDYGYEVNEMEWVEDYWISCETPGSLVACMELVPAHYRVKKHIGYLDRDRKPLSKSILVWSVKEISSLK